VVQRRARRAGGILEKSSASEYRPVGYRWLHQRRFDHLRAGRPAGLGQDPLVSTTLTVDENVQFVGVEMTNVSGRMLQLVLQEWSLSTSAETSNIVTAGTPNGQVQTVVLAPVTLSPGGKWTESVTMRSHHKLASGRHGGSYFTSMIPGVKQDALKQARHCEGSETITLLYVIQDGRRRS